MRPRLKLTSFMYLLVLLLSFVLTIHLLLCLHSTSFSINSHDKNDFPMDRGYILNEFNNKFVTKRELISPMVPSSLKQPTAESGWVVLNGNVTVHVGHVHTPHNYTYLINPTSRCESFDEKRLKLLLFIESAVKNVKQRQTIRDTWGILALQEALNFRIVFMVGVSPHTDVQHHLAEENVRYGDIVQEDFPDTFKHLALKSVMGLKWSVSFCNNADFVMKTDEDIFVHVPNLLNILHNFYSTKERTLICHFNRVRRILRKDFLDTVPPHYIKYMVTDKELPGQYFPPYCAGLGYVFPISVGEDLYKAALSTPVFFIEDVYITGFCRYKARVEMYDHPSFTLKPSIHPQQGSCAFSDGRVTSQELEPQELQELWKQVNTQGFFCPQVVGYLS